MQFFVLYFTDGESGHIFQLVIVVVVVLGVVHGELELGKISGRPLETSAAVLAVSAASANLLQFSKLGLILNECFRLIYNKKCFCDLTKNDQNKENNCKLLFFFLKNIFCFKCCCV